MHPYQIVALVFAGLTVATWVVGLVALRRKVRKQDDAVCILTR